MLTANAISGTKEMYLKEGFDEYLSKPINTKELDKILKKYFDNKAKHNIIKQDQQIVEENKTHEEQQDKNTLILSKNRIDVETGISYMGNLNGYNEALKEYYEEIDNKFKQLEDYIVSNDMNNYAIIVHGIKSESRYLGINNFADVAYNH